MCPRATSLVLLIFLYGCASAPPPSDRSASAPAVSSQSAASKPPITKRQQAGDNPPNSTNAWISLFDGKTLKGWAITDFAGRGEVKVENGTLLLEMGYMTGVTCTNSVPKMNYEVSLQAMRVDGNDFFCGLTFQVGEDPCSLIVGGWGGGVVGLSSLDGEDAAHNDTTQYKAFEKKKWYHIQLRVIPGHIVAWIDGEKLIDVSTEGRKLSIRSEVEPSLPFGISTWSTTAALKDIKVRLL